MLEVRQSIGDHVMKSIQDTFVTLETVIAITKDTVEIHVQLLVLYFMPVTMK